MKSISSGVGGRRVAIRAGVSLAALLAAGLSTGAWAQAEVQPMAPDATQAAAADQDVGEPGADDGVSDVVVTGRRAALEAADERKRRSETIVDSVVADDAGKLPDNSITEVLQRVSGVSIVRFAALNDPDHYSVQGSGVQVRGLTGVASRLNGREIFSANGGRAILWSDVTPELMAAVDVFKASTADLIEGGTGGQIDLRTKMPFDFRDGKFHVAATGELSVGDMANKADPMGSILLTDSFDTGIGRIGFLADIAYSQFSSLSQFIRTEPYFKQRLADGKDYYIPGGFTYGDEAFQYRRTGIYGAVQWAPSEALTFTGTFFQSRYKSTSDDYGAQVSNNLLAVDPATSEFDSNGLLVRTDNLFARDPGTFLPGGVTNSAGNKGFVDQDTVTRDYSLSFAWAPQDGPLTVKGAIQRVDSSREYNRLDVFRDLSFGPGFGMDLSGDLPRITVRPDVQAGFANPANYFWSASMPHNEDNIGRLDSGQLDAEYKFEDSFFRSVKIGGRYAKRTERDHQNGYAWSALGRGWDDTSPQLTYANAAPGDVGFHAFKDFFRGEIPLPGNLMFATREMVERYILDRSGLTTPPPAGFCGEPFGPLWGNCSASGMLSTTGYGGNADTVRGPLLYNKTENLAGYALVRFGPLDGDPGISGNVGLRVVNIKNEGTGFIQQNSNTFIRNGETVTLTQSLTPRGGKAEFTRFLPSVNLTYSPNDRIKLRAGYNVTLDLPTFEALRSDGSISATTIPNPANQPGQPTLTPIFNVFTAETGNPLLKPTLSNNFDLSFEFYLKQGTSFHIAPFYKRITSLPVYTLTTRDVEVVFADGTRETVAANAQDYINATEAATVKGVEVGGRFFLDMFEGFVSGFGFEGNYTFIDSKNPGNIYRDINGVVKNDVPLVGLSRHNFNAALLYERNPVSFRVAYSWRSRYLQTTTANGTTPTYNYFDKPEGTDQADSIRIALPVYGGVYGQLDGGIRFKVNDNLSFGVQGTNLLGATQRTLMGGYPGGKLVGRSWFQADRRIASTISLSF